MRTFSLKDDCTLSGVRIHPSDRPLILSLSKDGGGYLDAWDGPLIPAHGFVYAPVAGSESCPERSRRAYALTPFDFAQDERITFRLKF